MDLKKIGIGVTLACTAIVAGVTYVVTKPPKENPTISPVPSPLIPSLSPTLSPSRVTLIPTPSLTTSPTSKDPLLCIQNGLEEQLDKTSSDFQNGYCTDTDGNQATCLDTLFPKDKQYIYLANDGFGQEDFNAENPGEYDGHLQAKFSKEDGAYYFDITNLSGFNGKTITKTYNEGCYQIIEANAPTTLPTFMATAPTAHPTTLAPTNSNKPTTQTTKAPTQSGKNSPATEATLTISGVSVNVWEAPNGTKLYVPVGNSLSGLTYTPSEAWGYVMRNAAEANDKESCLNFLTSYLYYANQAAAFRSAVNYPLCKGLMGWSPYLDPSKGAYPNESSYWSAATDADIDIINSMLMMYDLYGDVVIVDTISSSEPGVVENSIGLKDLIMMAAKSFMDKDVTTSTYPGSTEAMLQMGLDNWGDLANPDYFDPLAFGKVAEFFYDNNEKDYGDKAKEVATGSMKALYNYAKASNGWVGDSPWQYPATAANFGYDAVRTLMRMGELLATPELKSTLGQDVYDQGLEVLTNLVNDINPLCVAQAGGTYQYNGGSGLSQAQFTGPLLMALQGLKVNGVTTIKTASGTDSIENVIDTVTTCFNNDMTNYDITNGMSGWQPYYFSMQLGELNAQIIARQIPSSSNKVQHGSLRGTSLLYRS